MATLSIGVTVNSEPVYLNSADVHHKFTVGELKAICRQWGITVDGVDLYRNGSKLSDSDSVGEGDRITTKAGKGEDGSTFTVRIRH